MIKNIDKKSVSLIGLGHMGSKLAHIYSSAGYQLTVWNRDKSKTRKLVDVADRPEEAIAKNQVTIICVYDNVATLSILNSLSDFGILSGKTIINFTTGSPEEAEELESKINHYGGYYLNGAIQVAPDQMAKEETTILISGSAAVYQRCAVLLNLLGGNLKYIHETAAAASAMDLATLTWLYGSYIGLIYGVKLCQSSGIDLKHYSEVMGDIGPGFTAFFQHEIKVIDSGNFEISQSPLSISVAATQRISESLKNLPVAQDFPDIIASILKQAESRGLASKELAAIMEVISTPDRHVKAEL